MSNEQAFEHRLKLLEQRFEVQAAEVSQLATEIQKAMEGFSQGTSMALQVIAERLKALEAAVPCQHEDDGTVLTSLPPQYKCKKCGSFYEKA